MKIEKIMTVVSIGAIVGFIIGLVPSLNQIITNRYFQYKMDRLIALALQRHFNKWVMLSIFSLIVVVTILLLLRFLIRFISKSLRSKNLEITILRNSAHKFRIIFACIVCFAFLLGAGWVVNCYWLPHIFHPLSVLCNTGILFFTVLLGWVLIRAQWEQLNTLIKIKALFLLMLLLFLNAYIIIDDEVNAPKGPNIILILIDCLRPDHLGCYGYGRETSPTIDGLAKGGILFANAYCNAPWTKPSVASIFTSLYPHVHKVITASNLLPDGVLTVAEILKNNGYKTYFFNGGNAFIREEFNFDQGFDTYVYLPHKSKNATDVTYGFLSQISKMQNTRFFAYLHYMDAHAPYTKNEFNRFFVKGSNRNFEAGNRKSKFNSIREMTCADKMSDEDKEYVVSLYDGQIRYIDENIRKMISFLKHENLLKDTLIIVTSDHGEEFWEHNNFEHGHTLYNELMRIPLIITGGKLEHFEIKTPVSLIDLMPTILEMVYVKTDEVSQQGVSVLQRLEREDGKSVSPIFAAGTLYGNEKYCLIKDNKKIIMNTDRGEKKWSLIGYGSDSRIEYYDLNEDPFEKENLVNIEIKTIPPLEEDLEKFKNMESLFEEEYGESIIVIDDELKDKLSSLGYLQ